MGGTSSRWAGTPTWAPGDFLLSCLPPVDWQTIEVIAGSVAPALKAAVAA